MSPNTIMNSIIPIKADLRVPIKEHAIKNIFSFQIIKAIDKSFAFTAKFFNRSFKY